MKGRADRAPGLDAKEPRGPWWFVPVAMARPFLASVERAGFDVRDPDTRLRVEVQVLYATLAGLSALMYAYAHWQGGSGPLTAFFVLLALGNALLLCALRRCGRLRPIAHGTVGLALLTITLATYWTGGLRLTNASPFFITLVAAVFLLGWDGLGWAALSVATPLAFQLAENAGVRFPDLVAPADRPTDAFMTWLVPLVVVALFSLYYEAARVLSVQRRAQAEAARSQFLANVSHELRNPLHAIMGMTDSALRSELPPQARSALEAASHNADALLVLIDDLLLLASMERSHFALDNQDFDPVEVLEEAASVIRPRCAERGLEFELAVEPEAPRWVCGDRNRLRQVLLNLALNAVKFTERGSVRMSLAPAAAEEPRLGARIDVVDTGVGIGPDDQARVFEQFTQADASTTRARKGAGLGLHIAREIVTTMGGTIELESQPGRGSRFSVWLPFAPPVGDRAVARVPSEPPASAPAAEQPYRVLVVDDDALNVRMAATMIEELGHEVVKARDGREAIEQWQATRPDLILMDIQMPELDGEEATRLIRAQEQSEGRAPVPIVAVTGHGTPQHREQYLAAGATDCLFKPFRFEDLESVVRARLGPTSTHARSAGSAR